MEQGAIRESGKMACTVAIVVTKGWRLTIGAEHALLLEVFLERVLETALVL